MAPAFKHPKIEIAAAADIRAEARARFTAEFSAPAYDSVAALCADPAVEAVYVATPHQDHAEHVRIAAARGKHVLVEKPMALTTGECRALIEHAKHSGIQLVVGHSHSFDLPVIRTRDLIVSGRYGRLRMITAINFTDFLYRPRRPEELRTECGGGVFFNQAPHQVDIARLLAGTRVKTVRAMAGAWDENRPTEGAYSCQLSFENGLFASLTYSGYGHFDTDEFMGWIAESGRAKNPQNYGAARALLRNVRSPREELLVKRAQNYGGEATIEEQLNLHQHFGVLIASCEHGDLRPMPAGIEIHADDARSFEPLPPPATYRAEVIEEFYAAAVEGRTPVHDGAWGLATMEVCLAMLRSTREHREISLDE
jgi:phthalate 4,5-cis-dihydrodiol dehydrogenase